MSAPTGRGGLSRLFRRLLPGPVGTEMCEELERQHAQRRARSGAFLAGLWYLAHLLHPNTWILAVKLRRGSGDASGPTGGISLSVLDLKLSIRMLLRQPGLSLVSGLAVAVSIAVGVGCFSYFQDFLMRPTVPLPDGERVVSLGLRNEATRRIERSLLHDFAFWREELGSVEDVGAFHDVSRNLIQPDGTADRVRVGEMSASGFRVARVPPLLGRPLLDTDEAEGAPPVLVIGYDVWRNRFDGDPDIVGRTVQLDREQYTIVGVMPRGFAFPLAHDLWAPLRWDASDHDPLTGPGRAFAFGRLAPGVTLAQADAEMAVLSQRRAAELPETHEHLRGQVMHYTDTHTGMDDVSGPLGLMVFMVVGLVTLVLAVPFVNVGILVYARTARRAGEIALRNALGASRLRVVTQLFIEALVLAGIAATAGVALALFGLEKAQDVMSLEFGGAPFWTRQGRTPATAAYAVGLTLFAAVVAGVVPGLKATGRDVQANLSRLASGNGMRLGGTWTALVVVQVATTVAFLPPAVTVAWQGLGQGIIAPTFAADELLAAGVAMPSGGPEALAGEAGPEGSRALSLAALVSRLEEERDVTAITWASALPGDLFEEGYAVEVETAAPSADVRAVRVGSLGVAVGFFEALDVAVPFGRTFHGGDVDAEVPPVMVNRTFVREVLGGANPVGRRVRFLDLWDRDRDASEAPWREIVGVVDDLVASPISPAHAKSRVFTPLPPPEALAGATLVLRVPSSPDEFAPRLRRIIPAVDPALRLQFVTPLADLDDPLRSGMRMMALGIGIGLLSVLLLATAGVYALMSFNVTQRRREIGIRSALGAQPGRVLGAVFSRAAGQLGAGALLGVAGAVLLDRTLVRGLDLGPAPGAGVLVLMVVLVVGAGLLAVVGPVRRGLRIEPSEALRQG